MFLFRLYLTWTLSWSILLMLLRYAVSLVPFPPDMVWSGFCHFSLTPCCSCLSWMPLISGIWMISTSMCVCQHFSQSQPTSRKCKQWILTSSSLLCTTASIPSRLVEYSFFCYMHHVSMMNLTFSLLPLAVFWHHITSRKYL